MAAIRFIALPTETARAYRDGAPDAYGRPAERSVSDGSAIPCRHCLADVAAGAPYLILAHRPFDALQPYAETGPIFLHADACERYPETAELPPMLRSRQQMIVRGYGPDQRIVYGTGKVVPTAEIDIAAAAMLARPKIAFVDVRSASNNCYQCRIVRH